MLFFLKNLFNRLFKKQNIPTFTITKCTALTGDTLEIIGSSDPRVTLEATYLKELKPDTLESIQVKPQRARNKGKFSPDNKNTLNFNEAWIGGVGPKKNKKINKRNKKTI